MRGLATSPRSSLRDETAKVFTVRVESFSRPGLYHEVTLEPESCSCEATIRVCRHIRIARVRLAKSSTRPCACVDGFVFVGYLDDNDVERTASYRCRRCAESR
jgi:hypothetical protein